MIYPPSYISLDRPGNPVVEKSELTGLTVKVSEAIVEPPVDQGFEGISDCSMKTDMVFLPFRRCDIIRPWGAIEVPQNQQMVVGMMSFLQDRCKTGIPQYFFLEFGMVHGTPLRGIYIIDIDVIHPSHHYPRPVFL